MMSDVINEIIQMQKLRDLEQYTTKELTEELIKRYAVKFSRKGAMILLEIANKGSDQK